MHKFFSVTLFIVAFSCCISFAQVENSVPQVYQSINNDTSPPLRDMEEAPLSPTPWENGVIPLNKIEPKFEDHYQRDQSLQKFMGATGTSDIIQSWDGVSAQGYAPPDNSGDVGLNHYMQMVNVRFQIWDKTGTSLLGPLNLGTIWSGFPGPWAGSLNDGDPVVLYDETADRWFATQFSLPNGTGGPNYILVAVSQTGDPTGSWHRYGFTFPNFPDYPKYGVWPDGYYVSANRFAPSLSGTTNAAFERSMMLIGAPAQMVLFNNPNSTSASLLPSDWDGTNTPPAGAPNYFGQIHDNARYGGTDGFDIFEFHVDWITPGNSTFTGPTFLATNPFVEINGIPQLGTSTQLDDLSDRVMNRFDYRNFGSHQSMVACHAVDAGGSRAGMRWYEFRNSGGGWSIYQEGTYAPADGLERWMGSIAINELGDIALGYSVSSSTIYPEIRYTGRFSGDAPGIMTIPEETIQVGLGSQTGGLTRWGDYTQMVVDPDGETFWYLNQYQPSSGSFNWKTRIASFSFGPPCPIDPPTNPNPPDGTVDVPLAGNTATWTNGAGADQIELWFGESGSLVQVYDGTPVTSFSLAPVEPLNYGTEYGWKVIGKNDSCDVSGPSWTFITIQDPNLFQYCDEFTNLNNWTILGPLGTTNWSAAGGSNAGGTPPELQMAWTPSFTGVSKLRSVIIPLSNNQQVNYSFNFFFDWYANPSGIVTMAMTYDGGATATAFHTFSDPTGNVGPQLFTGNFTTPATGSQNAQIEITYNGYSFNTDNVYWDNMCLEFSVPVELTSFTASSNGADVELTWSTATETNNQGFQVEKMNADGTFEQIGYLAGFGTTTELKAYSYIDSKLDAGVYSYRLKQIDFDGSYEYSDAVEVEVSIPAVYALEQNYPNPFNPSTTINYSIAEDGFVKLAIYNMLGEEVATVVNTTQKAGKYEVNFNASKLSSGVYVYRIEASNYVASKKLMLLK